MSAAHARDNRGHNNVVPITAAANSTIDDWNPGQNLPDDVVVETAAAQWSAEIQLLGALMYLPVTEVQAILGYVHDGDIYRPQIRHAIEIIRALAAAGQKPEPTLIVRTAQKQPPAADTLPGIGREWKITGQGSRYHSFVLLIANAYTNEIGNGTTAWYHAAEVLDDSYRRAFLEHGIRMQQMAEAMADVEDLTDYATGYFRGNLRDIWTRRNQLLKHRQPPKENQ